MEEKQDYLRRIFALAIAKGLCRTQKEFAQLLGINHTGLSSAMNGNPKAITDSLVRKVQAFAATNGIDNPERDEVPDGSVVVPPELRAMFEDMAAALRLQAELLTRYQNIPPAQKNLQADNKWR